MLPAYLFLTGRESQNINCQTHIRTFSPTSSPPTLSDGSKELALFPVPTDSHSFTECHQADPVQIIPGLPGRPMGKDPLQTDQLLMASHLGYLISKGVVTLLL